MNLADRSFSKNKDYYIIFGVISLVYVLSINTDLAEFSQHKDIRIPTWFTYLTLGVDLLVAISMLLIFLFRKIGIVLFPLLVMVHFGLHNYFLSTYLYSDITTLFLFIGIGLMAAIPRWKNLG